MTYVLLAAGVAWWGLAAGWFAQTAPPTDPGDVNSVLAWVAMLLVAAVVGLYADGRRYVARLERLVDEQTTAIKTLTDGTREQTTALKDLTRAVESLEEKVAGDGRARP